MHDLPIGYVVAIVSICAAVVSVCIVCVVALAPSFKKGTRDLFLVDEDEPDHTFGQPPVTQAPITAQDIYRLREYARHGDPPLKVVTFNHSGAKGFGIKKGRPS